MGNFSRADTFDRLKHYVSVRLQQGVPIVDADWNELQDIRKYELEAFLKWFVGDGVPRGNNGFAVVSIGGGDFSIADGRCLVEGWDAVNHWAEQHDDVPLQYTSQPLFDDALADEWGVDALHPLNIPAAERSDTVYLDIWEREVDAAEDGSMVNSKIGIETSVRTKREWVVRVAEDDAAPSVPPTGHVFYPLATLNWQEGPPAEIASVTDLRRTGVGVRSTSDIQPIVTAIVGDGYTLDHGLPDLKVSLREAINSVLAGALPGTATQHFTTGNYDYSPSIFRDASGDVWVFWSRDLSASSDIWYNRYDRIAAVWTGENQVTTASTYGKHDPVAFEDSVGDIWVFWQARFGSEKSLWYNRYNRSSTTWRNDTPLTVEPGWFDKFSVVEDVAGNIWLFWDSDRSGNLDIWYNRYDRVGDAWGGDSQLTLDTLIDYTPSAFADSRGEVWVFWRSNRSGTLDIWYNRHDGTSWRGDTRLTLAAAADADPVAVEDISGNVWVFWLRGSGSGYDVWYRRYDRLTGYWDNEVQMTTGAAASWVRFSAIRGAPGDIWVFWFLNHDVYYKHYNDESGWGRTIQVSSGPNLDRELAALMDEEEEIWLFWQTYEEYTGFEPVLYRRFFSKI